MKKQNMKKLTLSKETVRSLGSDDLRQIAGGTFRDTQCDGCYSGGVPGCYPSYNTCATRLC